MPAPRAISDPSSAAIRGAGNLRGIGWMFLTGLLFVVVTGIVRYLGTDLAAVQAAFLRYLFGLILILPVLFRQRGLAVVPRRYALHAMRGVVHGIAVMLWFFAMARIPIAEVTALGYTAPIFTTIGAALFLGETLRIRRIGAVLVAFGGAMIIVRPGFQEVSLGAIAQLSAAPMFAVSFVLAKKLTETETSSAIVAYLSVFVTLVLLPPALLVWRAPTWEELALLFLVAVFATLGHYTLTRAFQAAELAVTQPVAFLQLIWATLLGFYVFGEQPDVWTWIGGGLVVASATYIAYRQARAQRQARAENS